MSLPACSVVSFIGEFFSDIFKSQHLYLVFSDESIIFVMHVSMGYCFHEGSLLYYDIFVIEHEE